MYRRTAFRVMAATMIGGILTSCAKKKHTSARAVPTPKASGPPPNGVIASTERGLASWYGHPYHGRPAANGEIYDMEKLTAAHRTLPFNTWVRVTNLTNGKEVEVRITDRGPFIDGRIIDLSHAAARAIDLIGPGIAQVRLDVITAPPAAIAATLFAVQAGAYSDQKRAERLRNSLGHEYGSARIVYRAGAPATWRVLVGTERSINEANLLARRVALQTGSGFVVRLDE